MSYEDSYAKAFPFDKTVDGMTNPEMIDDTKSRSLWKGSGEQRGGILSLNNRAGVMLL